jgi:hypothetical protein
MTGMSDTRERCVECGHFICPDEEGEARDAVTTEAERLRSSLRRIASQPMILEMEDPDSGDINAGHDACIMEARAALTPDNGRPVAAPSKDDTP